MLARIDFRPPKPLLEAQLGAGDDMMGRLLATKQLRKEILDLRRAVEGLKAEGEDAEEEKEGDVEREQDGEAAR